MTTPDTLNSEAPKRRSPALVAGVVIAVLVILAGGAFVVYKLTNKTTIKPAFQVAKELQVAIAKGDRATIAALSTPAGDAAIVKLKPSSVNGLQFGGCQPFPSTTPIRVCTWTRPGGQLTIRMVHQGDSKDWLADAVNEGPAGLPPTSSPATPSSSTP